MRRPVLTEVVRLRGGGGGEGGGGPRTHQRPDQKGLNVGLWDHKVISKKIFSLALSLSDPISITIYSCQSLTQ